MTQTGTGEAPKEASVRLSPGHAAMLKALPFSDTNDFATRRRLYRPPWKIGADARAGQGVGA